MPDQKSDLPSATKRFAEAAEPSLRAALTHQVALIESGELETISRAEWDHGTEEIKRMFEKSRQVRKKL